MIREEAIEDFRHSIAMSKLDLKVNKKNMSIEREIMVLNSIARNEMAIKALEQTKWIPVSERLPKAGEYIGDVAKYYLIQNEYGDMLVARYTHGEYWEQIYQLKPIGDEIVAWMPLPESYKAESEVEK